MGPDCAKWHQVGNIGATGTAIANGMRGA
jgi:hypothetical protein